MPSRISVPVPFRPSCRRCPRSHQQSRGIARSEGQHLPPERHGAADNAGQILDRGAAGRSRNIEASAAGREIDAATRCDRAAARQGERAGIDRCRSGIGVGAAERQRAAALFDDAATRPSTNAPSRRSRRQTWWNCSCQGSAPCRRGRPCCRKASEIFDRRAAARAGNIEGRSGTEEIDNRARCNRAAARQR